MHGFSLVLLLLNGPSLTAHEPTEVALVAARAAEAQALDAAERGSFCEAAVAFLTANSVVPHPKSVENAALAAEMAGDHELSLRIKRAPAAEAEPSSVHCKIPGSLLPVDDEPQLEPETTTEPAAHDEAPVEGPTLAEAPLPELVAIPVDEAPAPALASAPVSAHEGDQGTDAPDQVRGLEHETDNKTVLSPQGQEWMGLLPWTIAGVSALSGLVAASGGAALGMAGYGMAGAAASESYRPGIGEADFAQAFIAYGVGALAFYAGLGLVAAAVVVGGVGFAGGLGWGGLVQNWLETSE